MDLGNNDLRQSNLFRSGSNLLIERPSRTYDNREYPRGVLNPIDKHVIRTSLNIDSRFRDNYYGTTSSDFTVSLPTKIKRVVQMELGEIEMPISFHTISASYGNNYFWIKENSRDPKCVIVPDGNYTGEDLALFVNQEISRLNVHAAAQGIKMIHDLNSKELVAVAPLLLLMLFIGIYPSFIESYVLQDVSVIYESINNILGES